MSCVHKERTMVKWVDEAWFTDPETGQPAYCNFYLMRCTACKELVGFPEESYERVKSQGWKP